MTAIRRAREYSRRRRYTAGAAVLVAGLVVLLLAAAGAFADAGNPITGSIKATSVDNGNGTITVFVRGQWNWYSHGTDCNFDRAGAGVGVIWDDFNGTFASGGHPARGADEVQKVALSGTLTNAHFTLTFKNPAGTQSTSAAINSSDTAAQVQTKLVAMASIGAGNVSVTGPAGNWNVEFTGSLGLQNVNAFTAGGKTAGLTVTLTTPTGGAAPVYNGYLVSNAGISAYVGTSSATTQNPVDEMVHPDDRGNQVQGYVNAGTDYPATQQFADPSTNNPNLFASWKGGCGRQPITSVGPNGSGASVAPTEKSNQTCADGTTQCNGQPWGSWGYEKKTTLGSTTFFGYSHTYLKTLSDGSSGLPDKICVNFYDVHGGGAVGKGFQAVNNASEITVDKNGDNSIDTNAFNVFDTNQGGNCVILSNSTLVTTATDATLGGAGAAGTIHDTAVLGGVPAGAGGHVSFSLYKRTGANPDCTNAANLVFGPVNGTPDPVNGSGTYTSPGFTPTAAGTYDWLVSYSGDASKLVLAIGAACGDQTNGNDETSSVGKASPQLVTDARISGHDTVMLSSVPAVGLTDSATLSGGVNETGAITFHLYRGTACTLANEVSGSPVQVTPTAGNGTYPSPAIPITTQGLYRWTATFTADSNNNGVGPTTCGDTNEDIKVINPAIRVTKTPHSQTIPSGGTASWTISVRNASDDTAINPGGTLADQRGGLTDADLTLSNVFTTDAQAADCQKTSAQIATLRGTPPGANLPPTGATSSFSYGCSKANVTTAFDNIVTATGTTTSGDQVTDDNTATENDRTGRVLIESLVTTATDATLGAGTIGDSAVLSGIPANAAGHVTFALYKRTGAGADCTIAANLVYGPVNGTPDPVNGPGTYTSGGFTPTSTGDYDWLVTYSGDAATSTAAINAVCGDQTNGNDETSHVSPASPGMTTDARVNGNSTVMLGASGNDLSDSATITGASNPLAGETITFTLYRGTTCDPTTVVDTRTISVSGNGTYSSADTTKSGSAIHVTLQGVYQWKAVFSGDANNTGKTVNCGDTNELLKVINPAIRVTKTPHQQTVPVGGTATWTISVRNASDDLAINPSGRGGLTNADLTLTSVFTTDLAASDCQKDSAHLASGGSLGTSTLAPGDTTSYTCSLSPVTGAFDNIITATGTTATNDQVTDDNTATAGDRTGSVLIENLVTTASDATLGSGTINDSAVLSGLPTGAAGHVTFSLYKRTGANADCTIAANLVYGPVNGTPDPVNGSGTYGSGNFTPTSTGTYDWLVSYSGDPATHTAAINGLCGDQTNGNDETSLVSPASPDITTDARVGGNSTVMFGATGNNLSDSGTITGASNPTGTATITFSLYRGTACTPAALVDTRTVNVNGNGTYSSGDTTIGGSAVHVGLQGLYRWKAVYSGDGNNTGKTLDCGGTNEDLKVINPAIRVTKTPHSQTVPSGGTAHWTIQVRNASDDTAINPGATLADQRGGLTDADLTLTNVFVSDNQPTATCAKSAADLAVLRGTPPGSTFPPSGASNDPDSTFSYQCSEANITASFDNIVTATGTTVTGDQVTDDSPGTAGDRTGSVTLEDLTSNQNVIPNDSASLHGFNTPVGGTMTFSLYMGACTAGNLIYGPVTTNVDATGTAVTANTTDLLALLTAAGLTAGNPQTYNWLITYSGDSNNNGAITPGKCGAENFTLDNDGHFTN